MWPGGWSRTRTISWKYGFSSLLLAHALLSVLGNSFALPASASSSTKWYSDTCQLWVLHIRNTSQELSNCHLIFTRILRKKRQQSQANIFARSTGEKSEEIFFKIKMSIFTYDRQLGSNSWKPGPWTKLGQYNWVSTE